MLLLGIGGRVLVSGRCHSVYPIYAEAARAWMAGTDLYNRPTGDPFRYSPLVAATLVPCALLPDALGGVLWRLINAAVYLGALAWWCRLVLPQPLSRKQRALLFLLALPLSIGSLNNGQSNALVVGLLLAGVTGVAVRRWNLAAGCIAVACLFKLYPLAVGLLLALLYPRRFSTRLALALAAGLLTPFLVQQRDYVAVQYRGWANHLLADDRQAWPLDEAYRDFRLLCRVWLRPVSGPTYLGIQVAAGAACAALCVSVRRAGWSRRQLLTLVFGLGCCWMTIWGFATESCTYMLLAPVLAWAVLESWSRWDSLAKRAWLLVSYGLFVATQIAIAFPAGRRWGNWGPQPLAALILFVCLASAAWRRATDTHSTNPAVPRCHQMASRFAFPAASRFGSDPWSEVSQTPS
jgi:hypothetical protein